MKQSIMNTTIISKQILKKIQMNINIFFYFEVEFSIKVRLGRRILKNLKFI